MTHHNRNQWVMVGGFVLFLAALVLAGWLNRGRFMPVEVGSEAPEVRATDLQGRPVALSELRGEVVLLNVWATWCGPCVEEMPSMQRLYETLGPEGLHIVAVSVDAEPGGLDLDGRRGGDVAEFASRFGLTFDVWRDPAGEIQNAYRTTGIPESFLIDRDGKIIKKEIGARIWDDSAKIASIRRLLGS